MVCATDADFIDTAKSRLQTDIGIASAEVGICIVALALLLICWKTGERYKRIAYSVCEYLYLVRFACILFITSILISVTQALCVKSVAVRGRERLFDS